MAGNKEDSLANLFELQDKERLFELNFYKSGGTLYQGRESSTLSVLNKLRLEGEAGFCDVILEVEGRQLTTHRCVLAANSQFFYTMFSSGMKDSNQKVLSLQSICFTSMSLILDYFYTREIVINDENVLDLLNASSFLLVTPVKNACSQHLSRGLSTDNCFSILEIAEKFGADELAKRANEYIKAKFFIVVNNEEFVSIPQKDLVRFISSDDLQVEKEEEVYQCVLRWVKHDKANRVAVLPELLKHLRKDSLPKGFLESEMEREPLLMEIRPDGDAAPRKTRKRKRKTTKKRKKAKSVQELRPSTETHNVIIGVKKTCPRKVYFYDSNKKEGVSLGVTSNLDFFSQIVFGGQTLYAIGESFSSGQSFLTALSFDEFKRKSPIERRSLEFESKTSFPKSKVGSFVLYLNGLLYYIGTCHDTEGSNDDTVKCYNPETDEWSSCSSTPVNSGRFGFGCVASEENIYIISGRPKPGSDSLLSTVEKYDPDSNSWSFVAPLKEARVYPGCVYGGGKIYVIGGMVGGRVPSSSCEVYSPLTDEWHTIAQLPYPFESIYNNVYIIENKVTVHYNINDRNVPCEALQYDLQSDRWLEVKTLGPSYKNGLFSLCSVKLPLFILQRIKSEFWQTDWDSSDTCTSPSGSSDADSDTDSEYGW